MNPARLPLAVWFALAALLPLAPSLHGAELEGAAWIWSPETPTENVPPGTVYFRKSFELNLIATAKLEITCDDAFELFVNGERVGENRNWRQIVTHDVSRYLTPGRNSIAVKAENVERGSAGLVLRLVVSQNNAKPVVVATDATWKTTAKAMPGWEKPLFNDAAWSPARVVGAYGVTTPWGAKARPRGGDSTAGEPQWIWLNTTSVGAKQTCCFRREFAEKWEPLVGSVQITCDYEYELFINGQRVGSGRDWKLIDTYDISQYLRKGRNAVAVKATGGASSAGLLALVHVKSGSDTYLSYSTSDEWRASAIDAPGWQQSGFDDSRWATAKAIGPAGRTAPWGSQVRTADGMVPSRFKISPEFRVERVATPELTGSIVAMSFDDEGNLLVSRERGPLVRLRDTNHDGTFDTATPLTDRLLNCQGLLTLDGQVYAVGEGPDGVAYYRLSDFDAAGQARKIDTILKIDGKINDHGPHAVVLGPDGMLYLMLGNFSKSSVPYAPTSPHHHYYEGDLVQPRFEDANGFAVGVKAPGGTIVRTDLDGRKVELFAGGFRNAYDFAFTADGDIVTYDSDMEWDEGMPWYRPTRFCYVTPGSEWGWRSGWAKWPFYFCDSLPSLAEIGRGSPTGVECYRHTALPKEYHGAIFGCDWARGRIWAVTLPRDGNLRPAKSAIFLEGRPLNVTDIAVGPDGWLYFITGGRGTEGGVYRITTTSPSPPAPLPRRGEGSKNIATEPPSILSALRQPQPTAAWARRNILEIKSQLGDRWGTELVRVAKDQQANVDDRIRALELMQWFGPPASAALLLEISREADTRLHARAAYFMGLKTKDEVGQRLVEMLNVPSAHTLRIVCDSLVRAQVQAPAKELVTLLGCPNPDVSWAARRALEQLPLDEWRSLVLDSTGRYFHRGAAALLVHDTDKATPARVLAGVRKMLDEKSSNDELLDTLRVAQLALALGHVPASEAQSLVEPLLARYPLSDWRVNRELVRLLVYLGPPSLPDHLAAQLDADVPIEEKLHVAMYASLVKDGWTPATRRRMLEFYATASKLSGGHSFRGYVANAVKKFVEVVPDDERMELIASGAKMPSLAIQLIRNFPSQPTAEQMCAIRQLEQEVKQARTGELRELAKAALVLLGKSGDSESLAYLHQVFETSPDRREDVAAAIARYAMSHDKRPEDWKLLVRSLPVVEGTTGRDVLRALAKFPDKGTTPDVERQVILLGLRLGADGARDAYRLLEQWTGKTLGKPNDPWEEVIPQWQAWFAATYPNQPEPTLPSGSGQRWTMADLLEFLNSDKGQGDAARGTAVFEKALCVKCHRYGNRGEAIGPDLSTVGSRFGRKEMLESVLFPSQVISEQFAAKTIITKDGLSITGIVGPAAGGEFVVLQSNGERATIKEDNVEEIVPGKKSVMPDGLFNELSREEIADLFAYMTQPPEGK